MPFEKPQKQALYEELLHAAKRLEIRLPVGLTDALAAVDEPTPGAFFAACCDLISRSLPSEDADLLLFSARIGYGVRFGQNAAFRLLHE